MSGKRVLAQIVLVLGLAAASAVAVLIAGSPDVADRGASKAAKRAEREGMPIAVSSRFPAAGSWPQWRGPSRDGIASEPGLPKGWTERPPKLLWKKTLSGPGYSGLVVAGGRLFAMLQEDDEEVVVCCSAITGEEIWRFGYPARFVSDQGSGPRSTPTIDGNRLYTVGASGILHCLDRATGEALWRRDLMGDFGGRVPEWGVSFSPLVEGELVFTCPGGSAGNSLAAFDRRTGKLRWSSLDDRPGYGSPVLTTAGGVRQVLFFTGEALVSVAPEDGRLYWRYPWTTTMDCNVATPIVTCDRVFISSGYGHGCALLEVVPKASGALMVERVYANTDMTNHRSTSVLYEGHLYGFDDARLTCMELATGEVRWQTRGFRKGSLIVADGHLIILGENGKLALAEATPAEYRERVSLRVSPNRCWTAPVVADGKLYVRDQQQIVCLGWQDEGQDSRRGTI